MEAEGPVQLVDADLLLGRGNDRTLLAYSVTDGGSLVREGGGGGEAGRTWGSTGCAFASLTGGNLFICLSYQKSLKRLHATTRQALSQCRRNFSSCRFVTSSWPSVVFAPKTFCRRFLLVKRR